MAHDAAMAGTARRTGRRPLGTVLRRAIGPSFGRRGFARAEILTRWPEIVGAQLARHAFPERLIAPRGAAGGTLRLRVEGGFATELQHLETEVIERINGYFGYRAVARLAMVQGPVPLPPAATRRKAAPLNAAEAAALDRVVASTEDERLRGSLAALGRGVIAKARAAGEGRDARPTS